MEHMKSSKRGRMVGECCCPNIPNFETIRTRTWSTLRPRPTTASTTSRKAVSEPRAESATRLQKVSMVATFSAAIGATPPGGRGGQRGASASSTGAATWSVRSVWGTYRSPPATRARRVRTAECSEDLDQWWPSRNVTDKPVEPGGHPCPVNLFMKTSFCLKLHGIHSWKNHHLQITREDRYCQYYYKCKFGFIAVDRGYCIPF